MNYPINPRAGIANVVYTAGLISSWTEGGYTFAVNRNDQGCPLSISAIGGDHRINTQFDFDASGVFVGMKGDIVPSNMLQQLVVEAVGGRVVQSLVDVTGVIGILGKSSIDIAATNGWPATATALSSASTDQTAILQGALNAASGREVIFKSGLTVLLTNEITIPQNTSLNLNGSTLKFVTTGAKNNLIMSSGSSVYNGTVENSGSAFSGHGGNQCPIVIGDYGLGTGVSKVMVKDVQVKTARPNGNGILVTSDSNNIQILGVSFPDSDTIGRPILIHWGGANTPSAGTTHPHNIRVRDIKSGTLTNTDASAAVVFISAAYDVVVDGVSVEDVECMSGVVQTFAGDYGNYYAPAEIKSLIMTGVIVKNVTAKKVRNTLLKVDNLSTLAPANMVLPGPDFSNIVGKSINSTRPAVSVSNCIGGSLNGSNDISGGVQAVLVGANVVGFEINRGRYHDCAQFPITVNNTTTPPEDCRIIDVEAFGGANAGGSYGSIYIGQSRRTICERSRAGAVSGETGVYGIRVDNSAIDSVVSRNHVYGVASGGVAYSMGASTTYGISREFLDNSAAAGITFHGGVNPQITQAFNRAGTANKICIGSAAPTAGTWSRGDKVFNEAPAAAGTIGWVCTTSATPGTWKTFGAIEA